MNTQTQISLLLGVSLYKAKKVKAIEETDATLSEKASALWETLCKYLDCVDMFAYRPEMGNQEISFVFTPCLLDKYQLVLDGKGLRVEAHDQECLELSRHLEHYAG